MAEHAVGHGYGLWLRPDAATESWASRHIVSLACQLGGPRFVPHVTLCAGFASAEQVARAAQAITGLPLTLRARGPRLGPAPFQTLVLEFEPSEALCGMRRACAATGGHPSDGAPHMSLYYGAHGAAVEAACAALRGYPSEVQLPRLERWDLTGDVTTWRAL